MWLIDWITNIYLPAKAHQNERNEVGEDNNEDKIENNDSTNSATETNIDNKKNLFSPDIGDIKKVNDDFPDQDDYELLNDLKKLQSKNTIIQCNLNSNQTLNLTIQD